MFTEFTRKRINEYVPDVYWVPVDINIVRFQIGCICTLTSFLRDHLGYRGCLKLKFRITLNQPNAFSAKIFVHTRTTTRFHEDTKMARSFVFDLSFYKRRATRSTPRPSFLPEARIQFTLHRLEQSFVIPRWTLQWIKRKEKILRRRSKENRAQLRSEIRSNERERENFETQSSIDLPPECRLSLSSSVTLTRIESSPIDFMSSTVMYRYCCWSLSIGSSPATWTQRELMVRIVTRETGTLQEGPKKKGGLGGGERGKISLAHTHVSNSCTRKQYIYMG